MPIYTRKGDTGETGLGDKRRVSKTHPRIEAVGTVDELNSTLGLAVSLLSPLSAVRPELIRLQNLLFSIGARLALPEDAPTEYQERLPQLDDRVIGWLETTIDHWWAALPELHGFILPGGSPAAGAIHMARSVSRRAERRVLLLASVDPQIDPLVLTFLNRLSDFLFAAARFANHEEQHTDQPWDHQI